MNFGLLMDKLAFTPKEKDQKKAEIQHYFASLTYQTMRYNMPPNIIALAESMTAKDQMMPAEPQQGILL